MNTRTGFGIVAVSVLVLLGGCALQSPTDVSDQEAHERFTAVLDDTQSIVGGSWTVQDDPTPRECMIPLWVAGERFPALRIAGAPYSIEHAVERVESSWRDRALTVTLTEVVDVVELKGESESGELYLFRVSESAMTLTGESECRPAA